MDGTLRDGAVHVGGDARQRYYDSSGYGRPLGGNEVALSRVEAAHLLFREELDSVDGMGFREFVAASTVDGFLPRFIVYMDLRSRGFYLSPDREGWVDEPRADTDLVVYPPGKGPSDDEVRYRVRVVGERQRVAASSLGDEVLAIVDEEGEISYFDADRPAPDGSTTLELPSSVPGDLLQDRVVLWDAPPELYESGFYGQPLAGRNADPSRLHLSLVEAAYLATNGAVAVEGGRDAVVERGRAVEGERFDRRLAAYTALRDRDVVPKTGFKFGADFRTYAEVTTVEELGHSELLVRVVPPSHEFHPRELALDVRLAGGVRKRMTFALTDESGETTWLSVERLVPS